jgi:hypothetical protein
MVAIGRQIMPKNLIVPAILAILLSTSACRSSSSPAASLTPTLGITHTATRQIVLSETPTPSLTASPTPALDITKTPNPTLKPIPDLQTAGPYLSLNTGIFYDMDGTGRRESQLPEYQNGSLSPDFRWYAYLSYEKGEYGRPIMESGIELLLINLWTGNERKAADLLPEDFKTRQVKMLEDYAARPTDTNSEFFKSLGVEPYDGYLDVDSRLLTWSPDSRHLAFPAMIDGNSTDVYMYDVDTGKIQRQDNSVLNVAFIGWSPDGKWILHSNHLPYAIDPHLYSYYRAVHVGSVRSVLINDICGGYGGTKWISGTEFLRYQCAFGEGGGGGKIYKISLPSGTVSTVWAGANEYQFAFDPETKMFLLNAYAPCVNEECDTSDLGLYFGPLLGTKKRIADGDFAGLMFRGGSIHRFVDVSSGIRGITSGGGIDPIFSGSGDWQINLSPDYRWMAVYGDHGLTLFDESDQESYRFKDQDVFSVAWDTNIRGFFFTSGNRIYRYFLGEKTARVLFSCLGNECQGSTSLSLVPDIFLKSLPSLRSQPPSIRQPAQGTSFWTKATYKDLLEPGVQEYTVTFPANSEWRWDFSWCSKTQKGLVDILAPLDIDFLIGGESIGEDIFRIYDSAKGGGFCRTWATLLSGWQPGDATDLEIRYTLSDAVNDGTRTYPVGKYQQIVHVSI